MLYVFPQKMLDIVFGSDNGKKGAANALFVEGLGVRENRQSGLRGAVSVIAKHPLMRLANSGAQRR